MDLRLTKSRSKQLDEANQLRRAARRHLNGSEHLNLRPGCLDLKYQTRACSPLLPNEQSGINTSLVGEQGLPVLPLTLMIQCANTYSHMYMYLDNMLIHRNTEYFCQLQSGGILDLNPPNCTAWCKIPLTVRLFCILYTYVSS